MLCGGFVQLILQDFLAFYQAVNTTPTEPCPMSMKWLTGQFSNIHVRLMSSHIFPDFLHLPCEVEALPSSFLAQGVCELLHFQVCR